MSEFEGWSRSLFAIMAEGATWGVPRSGLVFRKEGRSLILIARMPHDPSMPLDAEELRAYQDEDFEAIRYQFGLVDVEVRDETTE